MTLPDIDFKKIRCNGTQADAFEELCCQLANEEVSSTRARFDRKGRGGDAGVECFETLADGLEIGWQVKYYWDIDSMMRSLGGSLTKALDKHPNMKRFIVCFPFDLADARKSGTVSALKKWEAWVKENVDLALASGRTIQIERWDAHEIKKRLTSTNPRSAGRIAYWFDQALLTSSWFADRFDRTRASLGKRYDPHTHLELPIRQAILATTRDPLFFKNLNIFADTLSGLLKSLIKPFDADVLASVQAAISALTAGSQETDLSFPIESLRTKIQEATETAIKWYKDLWDVTVGEEPTTEAVAASKLLDGLYRISRKMAAREWNFIETQSLLVYGDAGSGKSHLLADACAHQLSQDRPAIMLLGGKFADAEPWGEILKDLDLPRHLQIGQFLGALNAAGEAAGVRTLIAIDALNEKNGQLIWPNRLATFLHDIEQFPWISVVLSCRTTYLQIVIPDFIDDEKLPKVEHSGFSIDEVGRYLKQRGITLPDAPLKAKELQTPLFLSTVCELLSLNGETLLSGEIGSFTNVFESYTKAVELKVQLAMGLAPNRKVVSKALNIIAAEMAKIGSGEIEYDLADILVSSVYVGRRASEDLLFQLETEGMFASEPMDDGNGGTVQIVRFTFERMGDHIIAKNLLDKSLANGVSGLVATGTPLADVLDSTMSNLQEGLFEALAIQVPERFDVELVDLTGIPAHLCFDDAFVGSLLTRRTDKVTARTWELIGEIGGETLRYDTLIAMASEPSNAFNAAYLDAELQATSMPQRGRVAWI